MTALNEAIYGRLQAVTGVTNLVGTRVYPVVLPQSPTYPAIRYQQTAGSREPAMGSNSGLVKTTVQIDSYSDTYEQARQVAEEVRSALQRFGGTVAGVVIESVFVEGPLDVFEEEIKKFRVQQDFTVWHRES